MGIDLQICSGSTIIPPLPVRLSDSKEFRLWLPWKQDVQSSGKPSETGNTSALDPLGRLIDVRDSKKACSSEWAFFICVGVTLTLLILFCAALNCCRVGSCHDTNSNADTFPALMSSFVGVGESITLPNLTLTKSSCLSNCLLRGSVSLQFTTDGLRRTCQIASIAFARSISNSRKWSYLTPCFPLVFLVKL